MCQMRTVLSFNSGSLNALNFHLNAPQSLLCFTCTAASTTQHTVCHSVYSNVLRYPESGIQDGCALAPFGRKHVRSTGCQRNA